MKSIITTLLALNTLLVCSQASTKDKEYWTNQACFAVEDKEYKKADSLFNALLMKYPNDSILMVKQARAYFDNGYRKENEKLLIKAIDCYKVIDARYPAIENRLYMVMAQYKVYNSKWFHIGKPDPQIKKDLEPKYAAIKLEMEKLFAEYKSANNSIIYLTFISKHINIVQ